MKYILLSIISLALFTNCTTAPMPGILFTSTTQHSTVDSNGNAVSSAKVEKSGKSCSFTSVLVYNWFYGAGQSVSDAATKGNIKKIAVIDRDTTVILPGVFTLDCVVVWGE